MTRVPTRCLFRSGPRSLWRASGWVEGIFAAPEQTMQLDEGGILLSRFERAEIFADGLAGIGPANV